MSEQSELYSNKLYIDMTKSNSRSSRPEVFLGKGVLEKCSKFTGEHPCRSAISIKLQSSFIKITHRYGCSPVNLLHFFGTPFTKNASGRLLLATVFVQGYLWTKLKLSQVPQSINKLKGTVTQTRIHSLLL